MRRILAGLAIIWFGGFVWFATTLPAPMGKGVTEAVIVPTGAAGRIQHGLEILENKQAKMMLVTGVDREVKPGEFAAEFEVPERVMECCVTLGFRAVDTRGNATETADWITRNKVKSIRLVTTDWHMRRAAYELQRTIPEGTKVRRDAVPSEPSLRILFLEYHKLLASWLWGLWRG